MLKFRNDSEIREFLVDLDRIDLLSTLEEESIDNLPLRELSELYFKKHRKLARSVVSFRRSQTTKKQWREDKWKMLKGIHKFHRSIQGKRFHRTLGRFLATNTFEPTLFKELPSKKMEALKGVGSLRTHLYIESGYYMPYADRVDFELFFEYAVPALFSVEQKILEEAFQDITNDEYDLLFRCVERKELGNAFAGYAADKDKIQKMLEMLDEPTYDSSNSNLVSLWF